MISKIGFSIPEIGNDTLYPFPQNFKPNFPKKEVTINRYLPTKATALLTHYLQEYSWASGQTENTGGTNTQAQLTLSVAFPKGVGFSAFVSLRMKNAGSFVPRIRI